MNAIKIAQELREISELILAIKPKKRFKKNKPQKGKDKKNDKKYYRKNKKKILKNQKKYRKRIT